VNYRCCQIIPWVKHFYTMRERCEVLTGYLLIGCRPGGEWANTLHLTKRFTITFQTRSSNSSSYFHICCKTVFGSSKLPWAREIISLKYIDSMARPLKMFHQPYAALSQPRRRVGTLSVNRARHSGRTLCVNHWCPKIQFPYLIHTELHSTYMCVRANTH
jgi:hypothetical protein